MAFDRNNSSIWNSLTTSSAFDRGPDDYALTAPTRPVGGEEMVAVAPSVSTPISVLVQSLVQQLCEMLEGDPSKADRLYRTICDKLYRLNLTDESYAMGEFEAMRHQYRRALYQLVSVARGMDASILAEWPLNPGTSPELSRYRKDFEESSFIADGGFGSVFRAKHRLDGVEYAVKKVYIRSSRVDSIMNHFGEVKTFASLNHPHIVSYKAAWLEPLFESRELKKSSDLDDKLSRSDEPSSDSEDSYLSRSSHDKDDFDIFFEEDIATVEKSINECNIICELRETKKANLLSVVPHVDLRWAVLYIQMELCPKTLKCWLSERNSLMRKYNVETVPEHFSHIDFLNLDCIESIGRVHVPNAFEIIKQLACAVEYIHQKGIIHHDIKPSNIFITDDGKKIIAQLADFGLACPLQKCHKGVALGTRLYAAPEQLDGNCNAKSDIYSLGIVFLELLEKFTTDMEKAKVFEEIKKGRIPENITANFPTLINVIKQMIKMIPEKRLNATQLLILLKKLKNNKEHVIQSLQQELQAKDAEIAAKDEEIFLLKKQLASISANKMNAHNLN